MLLLWWLVCRMVVMHHLRELISLIWELIYLWGVRGVVCLVGLHLVFPLLLLPLLLFPLLLFSLLLFPLLELLLIVRIVGSVSIGIVGLTVGVVLLMRSGMLISSGDLKMGI